MHIRHKYMLLLFGLVLVESLRFFIHSDQLANEIQIASASPILLFLVELFHQLHKGHHKQTHVHIHLDGKEMPHHIAEEINKLLHLHKD